MIDYCPILKIYSKLGQPKWILVEIGWKMANGCLLFLALCNVIQTAIQNNSRIESGILTEDTMMAWRALTIFCILHTISTVLLLCSCCRISTAVVNLLKSIPSSLSAACCSCCSGCCLLSRKSQNFMMQITELN